MKRLLVPLALVGVIFSGLLPAIGDAASPHHAMSVRILASTGPRTVSPKGTITFRVKVAGLTLSARQIGKKNRAGVGHLQYYLDRIPRDAHTRLDLRRSFLAAVGTPVFIFSLKYSTVRIRPGHHTILVALARNRYTLYPAAVARVPIMVR